MKARGKHSQLRERRGDEVSGKESRLLPRTITPRAPPIKMQGIKTKLVPLIARSIEWGGGGRWIEPFIGSAVVALNVAPQRALLADTNEHLIDLYRGIQDGWINGCTIRQYLEREGKELLEKGEVYYYAVRERFNEYGDPFDFIFLSRSCFNGMMRFNRHGGFNVPFCRKPGRFCPALITKITNQVEWARCVMEGKDWEFKVQDWHVTVADAKVGDMIYCDPPYIGRHVDYYNGFMEEEADDLAKELIVSEVGFALSMWLENKYRRNDYVDRWFSDYPQRTMRHFYHVGSFEKLRNAMTEVVILSENIAATLTNEPESPLLLFEAAEITDI